MKKFISLLFALGFISPIILSGAEEYDIYVTSSFAAINAGSFRVFRPLPIFVEP